MLLDGVEVTRHSINQAIKAGLSYVPEDRAAQGAFLSLGVPENLSAADPGQYVRRLLFGTARSGTTPRWSLPSSGSGRHR
jgi:ABC-type sugar transport system ATPase subunit